MSKDYLGKFNPTVPIDRVAARVLRKGVHHEFSKKQKDRETWEAPPAVQRCVPDSIKALLGERKGAMVVIGYLGSRHGRGGRLLVRCDCGRYEVRIARNWRNVVSQDYHCQFCEQREYLTRRGGYSSTKE